MIVSSIDVTSRADESSLATDSSDSNRFVSTVTCSAQHHDLTFQAGLDGRRRVPRHPYQATGVAPGLALELFDVGRLHPEEHGELRQRPHGVPAEERVPVVIRRHHADQAVRLGDLHDFQRVIVDCLAEMAG